MRKLHVKQKIMTKADEQVENMAALTRAKYFDRWMARTRDELGLPCECPEMIAYDDPQISLEWKLCDPANIVMLQSKKLRPKFLATLSDAEKEYLFSDPDALNAFYKHKLTAAFKRRRA